jgi:hypothetical protein
MPASSRWRPTGRTEAITSESLDGTYRLFERDVATAKATHRHYWLALVGFAVNPPLEDGVIFDHESIRVPPQIGCFICERPYSPMAPKRCRGES